METIKVKFKKQWYTLEFAPSGPLMNSEKVPLEMLELYAECYCPIEGYSMKALPKSALHCLAVCTKLGLDVQHSIAIPMTTSNDIIF